MTDVNPGADLAIAGAKVDELCRKVGLRRADLPDGAAAGPVPAGTALWTASYARLVLWPCHLNSAAGVIETARKGQEWFDEVLVRGEAASRGPIDGYLVLVLPCAPAADASYDIRSIELSSQVCRKHLIWPAGEADPTEPPGTWLRIADVTALGLPDVAPASDGEAAWPRIDSEAQAVWDDLEALGLPATLLQDDAS